MFEKEIVQEMVILVREHMEHYSNDQPPKVTLRLPDSLGADLTVLTRLLHEEVWVLMPASTTLCVDRCVSVAYCKDCGRQYRGPFLFDLCERCRGSHFEQDEHLQVSVEALDRRAPHKRQKEVWQFSMPAH